MGRISLDKERIKSPKKRDLYSRMLFPAFMENGIKAISSQDICTITGKSKATIYKHFDSKEEIVAYILADKLKELQGFQDILESDDSFENRYKLAVSFVSEILKDITPVFLKDLQEIYPELWEQIEFFKRAALEILKSFYEEGIQSERFIAINPEYLVLHDELFFNSLTNPELLSSKKLTLKEAFDAYFEIRFNGILTK